MIVGVGQNKGQWPGLDDSTGILMNLNGTISTAQMRRVSLESARQVMGAPPAPPSSAEAQPPLPGQSWPGLNSSRRGSRRSTGATIGASRRGSGGSSSSGGSGDGGGGGGNGASDLDDSETMRMYRKQQSGISSTVKAG